MLKLSINQSPVSDHSYFAEKTLSGSLFVDGISDDLRYLALRFATNPDGRRSSLFSTAILPKHFEEVARMMLEADPQAAIRAFGTVLQTAEVQRREREGSTEGVAA
jgi:hypothetical protein